MEMMMRVSGRKSEGELCAAGNALLDMMMCASCTPDVMSGGTYNGIDSVYISAEAGRIDMPNPYDIPESCRDILFEIYITDPVSQTTSYGAYFGGCAHVWRGIGYRTVRDISSMTLVETSPDDFAVRVVHGDGETEIISGMDWPYTGENIFHECKAFNHHGWSDAVVGVPYRYFLSGLGSEHCFGNDIWFVNNVEWFRPCMEILGW